MATQGRTDDNGERVIRDGNVVIDEQMNRREGLVEYEGTTEGRDGETVVDRDAVAERDVTTDVDTSGPGSMQAGATVFEGAASAPDRPRRTRTDGEIFEDPPSTELLEHVREGMTVVDANGDDIGKVDEVRMGDPQAATVEGQAMGQADTIVDDAAAAFGARKDGPDVPDPFRSELMRDGYVRVDGKGWIDTDRYLRAADIADVEGDTVRLRVAKEALPDDKM